MASKTTATESLALRWEALQGQQNAVLRELPRVYGFGSMASFVEALTRAEAATPMQPPKSPSVPSTKLAAARKGAKGRRLSDAERAAIIEALKGGMKGVDAVKHFGVSYPTVHVMKQELGLVKARGPKTPPGAAAKSATTKAPTAQTTVAPPKKAAPTKKVMLTKQSTKPGTLQLRKPKKSI